MLTPLNSAEAEFSAEWSGRNAKQSLALKAGPIYHYAIEEKAWREKGREAPLGNADKIYVESLMLYLRIHHKTTPWVDVEYQGRQTIQDQTYERVFFTLDTQAPLLERDHYRAYINSESQLIDYIAFTYRDLFDSYLGVIKLSDYRTVGNRTHPHVIAIQDSIDSAKPVHTIAINSMACFSQAN